MSILKSIGASVVRFFDSLFQNELQIHDNIIHIVDRFDELKSTYQREVQTLKDFKFNPAWKTRVIHVPTAIDAIRDIIQTVSDDWSSRFELIRDRCTR